MAATIVQYLGTGRRKRSVARVFLRPGKGEIKVNNRSFENYFPTESSRAMVRQPLAATETMEKFDLLILADGGGVAGQAGACPSGHFPRIGGVQRRIAVPAQEARLPHPRSRAPTSERSTARRAPASGSSSPSVRIPAKPEGAVLLFRPSGFAVFHSLDRVVRSILEAFRSLPRRKSRFGPRSGVGTPKKGCSVAGASAPII